MVNPSPPPRDEDLVDLIIPPDETEEARALASEYPGVQISLRAQNDLRLLASGLFAPIDRFLGEEAYLRVVEEMRLPDGRLCPIPITLPVPRQAKVHLDGQITLRSVRNEILATMDVEEVYPWDLNRLAHQVFGTTDPRHPLVSEMGRWGESMLSGSLRVFSRPDDHESSGLGTRTRGVPDPDGNRPPVLACPLSRPPFRAREEALREIRRHLGGTLVLQVLTGLFREGDMDRHTCMRICRHMVEGTFAPGEADLGILPLASRLAGPREAIWLAQVVRNLGATHLILDTAETRPEIEPGRRPFYDPAETIDLVHGHQDEIGIGIIPLQDPIYLPSIEAFRNPAHIEPEETTLSISTKDLHENYLRPGRKIPSWFASDEVARILTEAYPPRHRQGCCIWFTGLSGAGKSTTAETLAILLLESGRTSTLLDGDVVRTHLSKGLGFSKEDRDTNIRRIGFVAGEIARHGGIAICAAVSPYLGTRNDVRNMIGPKRFVEVFVDTPLAICESRDTKGLYARARRGELSGFTGIDDPYEPPTEPEVRIETVNETPGHNASKVLDYLVESGFVRK